MAAKFPSDGLSSSSGLSEETVSCLICTEPYNEPYVLPCHHTFCTKCLSRYASSIEAEGIMSPGTFPCPVCRATVTTAETGISTVILSTSTEDLSSLITKAYTPRKRVSCDVCKYKKLDVTAKDHCPSCGINYCEYCSVEHSKHCLFQNHSVIPVTENEKTALRCEYHETESVKYYCQSCLSPLCTICAVTDHQTHETIELHLAMGDKKETIISKVGNMSERVTVLEEFLAQLEDIQNLKEASIKKTKLEIERHVNNLIGKLHESKHSLFEQLESKHAAIVKEFSIEKEEIVFQLANMKSLWKFAAKLTDPSQSMQLLAMYNDVMEMIKSTDEKSPPSIPYNCILLNMFMPHDNLSVGEFQKCEMSTDILTRINSPQPSALTNGFSSMAGALTSPAQATLSLIQSAVSISRPRSAPPFIKSAKLTNVKYFNPKLQWKIDKVGSKSGEVCESYDVTMIPEGIIVAEWMNQRLQLFNDKGMSQSLICPGQIQPWGVTVTRDGNLAVTDDKDRTVRIVSPTGHIITTWKKQSFGWPRGVCENSLGQYIVSDTEHGKHTISIHLPDGRCVKKVGSQGSGNSQFHWPRYVTVDNDDRIIVSDGSNHCIKVLDCSGSFLFKFGSMGNANGQLKHPRGVCVDPQNNIIVADQDNNRVSLFNPEGKFIHHILKIGKPWGVFVNENGLLAVTQKPSLSVYKIFEVSVSPS